MRRVRAVMLLAAVPLAACLQISTGTGADAGAPSSASDAGGDGAVVFQEAGVDASGTGCGMDPTSGVTLCTGISACPGLTVDQSAFGGCGFRQGGASAFDMECLCAGSELCPIGVATSCETAQQLLAQEQSALVVCQQVSSGGCLSLAATGSGSSSGGLSQECQTCVAGCGGTPACYMSCGC